MKKGASGEVTDPRTWSWGAIVAFCALVVFVAFLFWQLGFNYGARQSNDLLLTSPDAGTEVVQLRAQLEEARTFQETLLNVVLASFAAGFTLLVLVNVGVIVLAQRNYDRDERAMRSVLSSETNEKIQAEATRASTELAQATRDVGERLEARITSVTDQLNREMATVNSRLTEAQKIDLELFRSIDSLRSMTLQNLSRLEVETWKSAALHADQNRNYLEAAELYSRIVISSMDVEWVGAMHQRLYVPSILRNLRQINTEQFMTRSQLEVIQQALTAATKEAPLIGVDSQDLADGLAQVEALLVRVSEDPSLEVPPPPDLPPAPS